MSIRSEFKNARSGGGAAVARIVGDDVRYMDPFLGDYGDLGGEPNATYLSIGLGGMKEQSLKKIELYGQELLKREIPASLGTVNKFSVGKNDRGGSFLFALIAAKGEVSDHEFSKLGAATNRVYKKMMEGDFGQPLTLSDKIALGAEKLAKKPGELVNQFRNLLHATS